MRRENGELVIVANDLQKLLSNDISKKKRGQRIESGETSVRSNQSFAIQITASYDPVACG